MQKLVEVHVAQAGVGGRAGGGIVEDLLVEILQAGKVGSAAEGDSVAEHGLRAREPGGREVHAGDRNLGRLVEQGCADELGLCTEHAGRAASRISWYWRWLSGSCQGTHLMAPSGLNHWCTMERRRRLGMLSWSSSSPG